VYGQDDTVHHAQLSWPLGGGIMLGSARDTPDDPWPVQPGTPAATSSPTIPMPFMLEPSRPARRSPTHFTRRTTDREISRRKTPRATAGASARTEVSRAADQPATKSWSGPLGKMLRGTHSRKVPQPCGCALAGRMLPA
jgi:hypothetical protein